MSRIAGWVFAACTLVTLSASRADACSCASPGSACEELWRAGAVFAGEVIEITDLAPRREPFPVGPLRVRFRVLESFVGIEAAETEIYTSANSASCGYPFSRGGRYVVFAYHNPDGRLLVTLCSATRPIGTLNGDLRYLRSLKAATPETGRVRGRAFYSEQRGPSRTPFPGARIVASGAAGSRVEVVTDRDGRFEIVAPPGRYVVNAEVSDVLYAEAQPRDVWIIDPGSCGEMVVRVYPDGHVSGRVVTEDGSPLAHVAVKLGEPKDAARLAFSYGPFARTDALGRFDVGKLPPGRYLLGVAMPRPPGGSNPGMPVLTTSGRGREEPREIKVETGSRVDVGDFVVRDIPRLVTLSGVVVDLANRPIRGVSMQLTTPGKPSIEIGPAVMSDEEGCFSIAAIAGGRYGILAELYPGGMIGKPTAHLPEILASADTAPVTITLPVPAPPVPRVR